MTASSTRVLVRVVGRDPLAPWGASHVVFTFARGGQSLDGFAAATLTDLAVGPYRDAAHAKTGRNFAGLGWFWVSPAIRAQLAAKVRRMYPGVWKTIAIEPAPPLRGRRP